LNESIKEFKEIQFDAKVKNEVLNSIASVSSNVTNKLLQYKAKYTFKGQKVSIVRNIRKTIYHLMQGT